MSLTLFRTDLQGLPVVSTSLIGRDELIERVQRALLDDGARLLTLLGPGGIGKTRVSLAVAEALRDAFAGRVAFVSLASVPSVDLVPSTIAVTLDIDGASDQPLAQQIAGQLRAGPMLLVLDNFEHLLEAAPFVAWLSAEVPSLQVLITSRSELRISGERVISVPPLALPDARGEHELDSPAVRLYLERSGEAGAPLESLEQIAEVCRRLDGLPLAIELAAASRPGPENWSLAGGVLVRDEDSADARQRTMSSTVAWSYNLLSVAERTLLRRLSGFTGGFSLDAVAAISAELDDEPLDDPVELVVSLIEQSLVLPLVEIGGEAHGSMLQTIAEFGLSEIEMLGEAPDFFAAHARWCFDFAHRAEPELRGADQLRWVQLIEAQLGNVRRAIEWYFTRGDIESALRLTSALGWFWSSPGHFHEGRDLYNHLLAQPLDDVPLDLQAKALESAGDIEDWLVNLPKAREHYERAAAICRQIGDLGQLSQLTRGLGSIAIGQNDFELAAALFLEAIESSEASGNRWNSAASKNLLGALRFAQGSYDEAIALSSEAREIWRFLEDPGHVVAATSTLVGGAIAAQRYELARENVAFALEEADRLDDPWFRGRLIAVTGALLIAAGRLEEGLRLMAHGDAVTTAIGTPLFPWMVKLWNGFVERARTELDPQFSAEIWAIGYALDGATALAEAQSALKSLEGFWSRQEPERPQLTRREIEVLKLLAHGKTDREIADELFVERRTVSKHVAAILEKLDVPNRSAAASSALRLGIIDS